MKLARLLGYSTHGMLPDRIKQRNKHGFLELRNLINVFHVSFRELNFKDPTRDSSTDKYNIYMNAHLDSHNRLAEIARARGRSLYWLMSA